MYPKGSASVQAVLWLEREAKRRGIYIHHAICGHGGERWLKRGNGKMKASPVDGYNHETRIVFQYHGCPFHGCPKCYPRYREQMILNGGKTPEELYQATMNRTAFLRKMGYEVIEAWSCEVGILKGELPKKETKTYPHAILYDFESYGDKNYRKEPAGALTIENAHIPISVSIGDTLERKPTHICERDPAELVRKFMKEPERRAKNIQDQVRVEFVPEDVHLLPKEQWEKIREWCDQVPILGFNSGTYDLNLIKTYFASVLAEEEKKIRVAKKGNKVMFLLTRGGPFPRHHRLSRSGDEL